MIRWNTAHSKTIAQKNGHSCWGVVIAVTVIFCAISRAPSMTEKVRPLGIELQINAGYVVHAGAMAIDHEVIKDFQHHMKEEHGADIIQDGIKSFLFIAEKLQKEQKLTIPNRQ